MIAAFLLGLIAGALIPTSSAKALASQHRTTPHGSHGPVWGAREDLDPRMVGRIVTGPSPRILRTPLPPVGFTTGISRIKCREYCRFTLPSWQADYIDEDYVALDDETQNLHVRNKRIVQGGIKCEDSEFPHVVALGFHNPGSDVIMWNSCGGVLISDSYVLTAAHCTDDLVLGAPVVVRLGALNVQKPRWGRESVEDVNVTTIHVHPEYKAHTDLYNDIALLKLEREVTFRGNIQPACLYDELDVDATEAVATGWGNTGFADAPSDILQKVTLDIISNQRCRLLLSPDPLIPDGIRSSQVCAGKLAGGHDTCTGDSGGPLQVNNTRTMRLGFSCGPLILGITSFGKYCGEKDLPGVYTRLATYVPWIESIVWAKTEYQTDKPDTHDHRVGTTEDLKSVNESLYDLRRTSSKIVKSSTLKT